MIKSIYLLFVYILMTTIYLGCINDDLELSSKFEIPTLAHDVGYISYDAKIDNYDYRICDSTKINSGRNRIQYIGGTKQLKKDILSNYLYNPKYEAIDGYITIRFLINCENESGRYRAKSVGLDFSPLNAPSSLLMNSIQLIKNLDNWAKASTSDRKAEYLKFINLKIKNGKIQHILL